MFSVYCTVCPCLFVCLLRIITVVHCLSTCLLCSLSTVFLLPKFRNHYCVVGQFAAWFSVVDLDHLSSSPGQHSLPKETGTSAPSGNRCQAPVHFKTDIECACAVGFELTTGERAFRCVNLHDCESFGVAFSRCPGSCNLTIQTALHTPIFWSLSPISWCGAHNSISMEFMTKYLGVRFLF